MYIHSNFRSADMSAPEAGPSVPRRARVTLSPKTLGVLACAHGLLSLHIEEGEASLLFGISSTLRGPSLGGGASGQTGPRLIQRASPKQRRPRARLAPAAARDSHGGVGVLLPLRSRAMRPSTPVVPQEELLPLLDVSRRDKRDLFRKHIQFTTPV